MTPSQFLRLLLSFARVSSSSPVQVLTAISHSSFSPPQHFSLLQAILTSGTSFHKFPATLPFFRVRSTHVPPSRKDASVNAGVTGANLDMDVCIPSFHVPDKPRYPHAPSHTRGVLEFRTNHRLTSPPHLLLYPTSSHAQLLIAQNLTKAFYKRYESQYNPVWRRGKGTSRDCPSVSVPVRFG